MTGSLLTDRDRAFLGSHNAMMFLTLLTADTATDARYPDNVAFMLSLLRGTYDPDAPAREMHGTLDPDAWNAAVLWVADWCKHNNPNPWHILTGSILTELHDLAASDPRATDVTRSHLIVALALS